MLSENQQIELLTAYPVLRDLPPRLWQELICEGQSQNVQESSIAFDAGDPCRSYLMVTSGSVRVVRSTSNGRELLLYRVLPGDNCILTVSCLLGDCSYQARGIVEAGLTVVLIARPVFLKLDRTVVGVPCAYLSLLWRADHAADGDSSMPWRSAGWISDWPHCY